MFRKIRLFALFVIVLGFQVSAQGRTPSNPNDPEPWLQHPEKVYNMLDYMIPQQNAGDERQFHLEGYMSCVGIPGSECLKNGEPDYARGGFQKQYLSTPDSNGNIRFTTSKAHNGLLAYPCEYYQSREGFDEDNQPTTFLYIYAEMMDWSSNERYRAYYDVSGEPTFEMARSRARNGRSYLQNPGFGTDYACGVGATKTYPLMDSFYIPYFFKFTRETINAVNLEMGSFGPVDPNWLDMALAMGQNEAELMVIVGQFGYTGAPPGPEGWRWLYRELYIYLKGVGWVSWRWQEHQDNDQHKDFITHKFGQLDTIVWESAGQTIRNVDLCEPLP